ncbi:MAG: hypothetical protein CMM01_23115 [Rhodopirellula sp.]|nr:hypothetical protein [Rhodopirellula sp.]
MAAAAKISPRPRLLHLVFAIGLAASFLTEPSFALQFSAPSGGNGFSNQPGLPVDAPQTNLTPIAPPPAVYQPPAGYGSFDPYATTTPGAATAPIPGITNSLGPGVTTIGPPSVPAMGGASIAPPGSLFGKFFSRPASQPLPGYGPTSSPSIYGAPAYGAPAYGAAGANGLYGPAGYPTSAYPASTPNSLFPRGLGDFQYDALMQNPADGYSAYSLLQGPRFRYTVVGEGSKPYMLGINDFDTSIVFAFPNFLFLTQPLYVVPSFSLHLWSGPQSAGTGVDLPSKAYSAFLDVGWESDPTQMFGTEFGVRFGGFSEFGVWNSRSFRVMGKALANFRLTPTTVMKGGVYYVNRVDIKLVPAFGFQCQPNPQTRLDLFFPQPRFSRYCRTVGTRDVWWYLSGDYGGGSWTVERTSGPATGNVESIAIDDLRAVTGFEWGKSESLRLGRRAAFAEIGWVFKRKVKYRSSPSDNFDPKDSFMFRVGVGY